MGFSFYLHYLIVFQCQNREYYMQFVTEDIDDYVLRKRNNYVHGNHIEIQAISEIFNRPVEIYAYHTGKKRACLFIHLSHCA